MQTLFRPTALASKLLPGHLEIIHLDVRRNELTNLSNDSQNFLFFFTGAFAFSSNCLFSASRLALALSTGSSGSAGSAFTSCSCFPTGSSIWRSGVAEAVGAYLAGIPNTGTSTVSSTAPEPIPVSCDEGVGKPESAQPPSVTKGIVAGRYQTRLCNMLPQRRRARFPLPRGQLCQRQALSTSGFGDSKSNIGHDRT